MREAFEKAILENPDDLAGYAAYADWQSEQGDPRGEFMQVQLALEDEGRPAEERKRIQKREQGLLRAHERVWLGELAQFLRRPPGPDAPRCEHRWQRGFLAALRVQCLTRTFAQRLATAPEARALRELAVYGESRYWGLEEPMPPPPRVPTPMGAGRHWELFELIGAPCLQNLRFFQMGDVDGGPPEEGWGDCHTYAPGLEHVVACMPRVEELHLLCKAYDVRRLFALPNLRHLRVLRVYHLGVQEAGRLERRRYEYPLDVLATNPALANLTHLLFHPHQEECHPDHYGTGRRPSFLPLTQVRALLHSPHLQKLTHLQLRLSNMGNEGCVEFVRSGRLQRLKWLDLRHGCIRDKGAGVLATCPDLRRLEHLDLSHNALTQKGIAALWATGVNLRADNQQTAAELAEEAYLFEGDGE
jgi:uncharacterized protein (TIGR02996 family)